MVLEMVDVGGDAVDFEVESGLSVVAGDVVATASGVITTMWDGPRFILVSSRLIARMKAIRLQIM